jgi:hypothetical protein
MARVYPPIWCEYPDCQRCEKADCDSRILALFAPFKTKKIDFSDKNKMVEITSIAIYFEYCEQLAKFFLLFPQESLDVVKNNFVNSSTGEPTNVAIQRIFLDMLDHSDADAPTDGVHKFRLKFGMIARKSSRGYVASEKGKLELIISKKERNEFVRQIEDFCDKLRKGKLATFKKTENLLRCKYCFLPDCDRF